MTKSELAIVAKKIRCELRRRFINSLPTQLFRVTIQSYQSGWGVSMIYIEWHGAPSEEEVRVIVEPYVKESGIRNLDAHYVHRELHTSKLIRDMKKLGGEL